MRTESTFVQQMFQYADKDKSGTLSFKEFADLVILLMKGNIIPTSHAYLKDILKQSRCYTLKIRKLSLRFSDI